MEEAQPQASPLAKEVPRAKAVVEEEAEAVVGAEAGVLQFL